MMWNTDQGTVWMIQDGEPYWVSVGISDVNWTDLSGICPYCGNVMEDGTCSGCQNKTPGTVSGVTEVTFRAPLPSAAYSIFNLYPGQVFRVLYPCSGRRDRYSSDKGYIEITVLRMKKRSMAKLAVLWPDEAEGIELYTVAECRMEIILPEE